jgi:hypothetical protein
MNVHMGWKAFGGGVAPNSSKVWSSGLLKGVARGTQNCPKPSTFVVWPCSCGILKPTETLSQISMTLKGLAGVGFLSTYPGGLLRETGCQARSWSWLGQAAHYHLLRTESEELG